MLSETSAAQSVRSEVMTALRQASAETGSDFNYLLGTAMRESSLRPAAKSAGSSAAGLFQFVQQTWLGMVKQYGAKFGLGSYADAIRKDADGRYTVDSQADRTAILSLRNDPKVSALMAGEYAQATRSELQARLGRHVSDGELYAAHFLGPGAACRLIEMAHSTPHADAAACFPTAADANRSVFYRADGSAKSVAEVYHWAVRQPEVAAPSAPTAPNASAPAVQTAAVAPAYTPDASFFAEGQHSGELAALGLFRDSAAQPLIASSPLPQTPLVLTPGVMNLFASLDPAAALPKDEPGHRKIS